MLAERLVLVLFALVTLLVGCGNDNKKVLEISLENQPKEFIESISANDSIAAMSFMGDDLFVATSSGVWVKRASSTQFSLLEEQYQNISGEGFKDVITPKFTKFFQASDWLIADNTQHISTLLIKNGAVWGTVKNLKNLVVIQGADGTDVLAFCTLNNEVIVMSPSTLSEIYRLNQDLKSEITFLEEKKNASQEEKIKLGKLKKEKEKLDEEHKKYALNLDDEFQPKLLLVRDDGLIVIGGNYEQYMFFAKNEIKGKGQGTKKALPLKELGIDSKEDIEGFYASANTIYVATESKTEGLSKSGIARWYSDGTFEPIRIPFFPYPSSRAGFVPSINNEGGLFINNLSYPVLSVYKGRGDPDIFVNESNWKEFLKQLNGSEALEIANLGQKAAPFMKDFPKDVHHLFAATIKDNVIYYIGLTGEKDKKVPVFRSIVLENK